MAGMRKLRGKYYVRVFLPGGKEKLIPTKTGDRKQAEAKRRLIEDREFLVKARLAEDMGKPVTTLFEAVDMYLTDCRSRLKKSTFENYELSLRNMKECWGDTDLRRIAPTYLATLREYLSARVGPVTVNIRLRAVRTFLCWLVANEKMERFPGKMSLVKVDTELPKFFTPEELERTMAQVKDPQMKSIFRVLAETGLRRGELFQCTLEDGYLHLHQTKGRRDRLVAIHPELIPDFHEATKAPRNLSVISRAFQNAIKASGIKPKGRSLHSLRHTFALREYYRTGDIYYVRGLLGHQHVATTEIYLQFPGEYLDRVFGGWVMRYPTREIVAELGNQKPAFQA